MSKVFEKLTQYLTPTLTNDIKNRVENMMREIRYLKDDKELSYLDVLEKKNWTLDRLRVICVLNSFFQKVLSPLTNAVRGGDSTGLVEETTISYGEDFELDEEYSFKIRKATRDFYELVEEIEVPKNCLKENQAYDMIEALYSHKREIT